jgi:hypothetical protein
MRTGFIPRTPVKILLIGLLSFSVPPRVSVAQSSAVKLFSKYSRQFPPCIATGYSVQGKRYQVILEGSLK